MEKRFWKFWKVYKQNQFNRILPSSLFTFKKLVDFFHQFLFLLIFANINSSFVAEKDVEFKITPILLINLKEAFVVLTGI